jgi:hypothetical protein
VHLDHANLCDTADVLIPVFLGETQVLVQPEAHVVSIKTVRGETHVEEVLFEGSSNSRLARGREASEPDGKALLATQLVALMARERRMPGNIAGCVLVMLVVTGLRSLAPPPCSCADIYV